MSTLIADDWELYVEQELNECDKVSFHCNCWEGYICDYCIIRKGVLSKLKDKFKLFNSSLEQNAELFIKEAIRETIEQIEKHKNKTLPNLI